ncbi:hypothetical protein [Marinobacter sp.]|uniref:hypothetical protein n=1 Tax=Marinobacter sp. TaxID=50741 RepID=UPI001B588CCD|nr:hypothetical protein [Marinobacter sp.]MBQ0834457.1 hypothetical protein [Marinobacter sp.]
MSESIEDLKQQIEKLQAKNYQILDEKKKAQAQRDEAFDSIEALTTQLEEAKLEVQRITVEQPRQELFESVAMPDMAGAFERELLHHFDIERNENGADVLVAKSGDTDPLPLTAENLHKLYDDGVVRSLGALMKGSGMSGGGATGGSGGHATVPKRQAPQKVQFGMR